MNIPEAPRFLILGRVVSYKRRIDCNPDSLVLEAKRTMVLGTRRCGGHRFGTVSSRCGGGDSGVSIDGGRCGRSDYASFGGDARCGFSSDCVPRSIAINASKGEVYSMMCFRIGFSDRCDFHFRRSNKHQRRIRWSRWCLLMTAAASEYPAEITSVKPGWRSIHKDDRSG